MLFSEEDAVLLKAWIVKRIENTSDADADVLAEYVIALLKHEGDAASVRLLCEQEIPDFLTEDPKKFLDDVFQAITYRSYVPGAPPQRPVPEPAAAPGNSEPSRKRRFDDGGVQNGHERHAFHGRATKHPRRGRRGGRAEDRFGHAQFANQPPVQQYPMGLMMPTYDPNNPMEAMMGLQAMSMALSGMGDTSGWFQAARGGRGGGQKRKRCRDFDARGYCARGSTCNFDHGGGEGLPGDVEYDPSNAMILPFPPPAMNPHQERARRGKAKGEQRKGGARAPFSAEGPLNDKSKTAIVVENIPEESFGEEAVRAFFSQYGDIVDVSMQPYKHLAIVKYRTWSSANDAYRSPKVIFDNRFVKVFWYKDEADNKVPLVNGAAIKATASAGPDEPTSTDPEIDMAEFQRKQEEAQKLHREREEKKTELQKQREALEVQQQELLAKRQAETERLQAKLAEKKSGSGPGMSSSADLLRAKLAALEQEAKILGIDPDAAAEQQQQQQQQQHVGGYRGRWGGGAAGFAPRGRAASHGGRGGPGPGPAGRHAAYALFSIDNRPRRLAVTGVDFTPSDKDEMLRHFVLNMGEFESVATTPPVSYVSFRDRKTAEKFYATITQTGGIPGVEGKLEVVWVVGEGGGVPSDTAGDAMAGIGPAGEADDPGRGGEERRTVNMDYEAGDGDGYGWEA